MSLLTFKKYRALTVDCSQQPQCSHHHPCTEKVKCFNKLVLKHIKDNNPNLSGSVKYADDTTLISQTTKKQRKLVLAGN